MRLEKNSAKMRTFQGKFNSRTLLYAGWGEGICGRFRSASVRVSGRLRTSQKYHHHHKHQGLDTLIRSVSRVTAARANASSVFQFFSFLVVCSGMISKGLGFVAFFASVKASSVCIHLYCLVSL